MAKLFLNNKIYNIDDSALASGIAELKSHLTIMNGTGATITLGGTEFSVDSTKLTAAMNSFVSHLGTIAGNGAKVMVNGVEYAVDATKIAGAMSELGAAFGELENGGSGDSDSIVGTWRFNSTLTRGCPRVNINFTTNNNLLNGDGIDCGNSFITMFTPYSTALYFSYDEMNSVTGIGMSGFADNFDGVIHITGGNDIDNEDFIAWLNENATKVGGSTPETPDSGDGDTSELEGSGQSYRSVYPAPLYFRSTAPLDEFQGVTINGETLDPSNYTLTEGSTIVMLSVEYLNALHSGSYEIGVVSQDSTAVGNFSVVTPAELEAGLYDADDNLVASWDALVNTYGLDITKNYNSSVSGHPDYWGNASTSGYNVFAQKSELANGVKLVIDDSVIAIGVSALHQCASLKYVEIPASVITIASDAFSYCRSLERVIFAEGSQLTSIDNRAFANSALKNIDIPARVEIIGQSAFRYCNHLENIIVDKNNVTYTSINGVLYDKYITTLLRYPCSNSIANLILPSTVTTIGDFAFEACRGLTSITISEMVTTIGIGAFSECKNLAAIKYTGTVEQWNAITFGDSWNILLSATGVRCSNGYVHWGECYYMSEETIPATCISTGVMTYTCPVCGDSYTEEIPTIAHNYKSEITQEPTCTTAGVKTYTCSVCGDSYTEEITPKHSYVDGICVNCGAEQPAGAYGTWKFNSTLTSACPNTFNIVFTTNNDLLNGGGENCGNSFIAMFTPYAKTLYFSYTVDFGVTGIGMGGFGDGFDGVIHIHGGDDVTNETFINWLNANASKVDNTTDDEGGNSSNSIVGVWAFNDEISLDGLTVDTEYPVSLTAADGKNYTVLKTSHYAESVYRVMLGWQEFSSIRYDDVYHTDELYGMPKGWMGESYKTITIIDEPTNPEVIAWIQANATKIA